MKKIAKNMVEILKELVLAAISLGVFILAGIGALALFGSINGLAILVLLIVFFVVVIDNLTDNRAK